MQAVQGLRAYQRSTLVTQIKPAGEITGILLGVKAETLDGVVLEWERDLNPEEVRRAATSEIEFQKIIRDLAQEAFDFYEHPELTADAPSEHEDEVIPESVEPPVPVDPTPEQVAAALASLETETPNA